MPSSGLAKPRSLADALRQWPVQQLEALLRARPDIATAAPGSIRELALHAGTSHSVLTALNDLTARELAVLETAVALGSPTSVSKVVSATLGPMHPTTASGGQPYEQIDVLNVITRLRERALLWGDDEDLNVVRAAADTFGAYPCDLFPHLSQARPYLRRWEVSPAELDQVLSACSNSARQTLEMLAWRGPTMQVQHADRLKETGTGEIADLLRAGLLIAIDSATVAMPREVALHLRHGVWRAMPPLHTTPFSETSAAAVAASEHTVPIAATHAAAALATVKLAHAAMNGLSEFYPKIGKGGQVLKSDISRFATSLGWTTDATTRWIAVLMAAGIVGIAADTDEVVALTRAADEWLQTEPDVLWSHLTQSTMTHAGRILFAATTGVLDSGHMDIALVSAYQTAFAAWVELAARGCENDKTTAQAWAELRPRIAIAHPQLASECERLATSLGIFVSSQPSGLANAVRIKADDVVRAAMQSVRPPEVSTFVVQPDHSVLAAGRLRADIRDTLLKFSDLISEDQAFVARITPAKVRSAMSSGWTSADIDSFLAEHSTTPAPQSLEYLIADCARMQGPTVVDAISSLIRTRSNEETQRILANPRCARLQLIRIDDTVLASVESPALVSAALNEAGFHVSEASSSMTRVHGSGLRAGAGWLAGSSEVSITQRALILAQGLAISDPADPTQMLANIDDDHWHELSAEAATTMFETWTTEGTSVLIRELRGTTHSVTHALPLHVDDHHVTIYEFATSAVRTIHCGSVDAWCAPQT